MNFQKWINTATGIEAWQRGVYWYERLSSKVREAPWDIVLVRQISKDEPPDSKLSVTWKTSNAIQKLIIAQWNSD